MTKTSNTTRRCSLAAAAIVMTTAWCAQALADSSHRRRQTARYAVAVQYRFDLQRCFPKSWYRAPARARAEPIRRADVSGAKRIVDDFLSHYPVSVVDHNLHAIYLFARLRFYDHIEFGGTYSGARRAIYLRHNTSRFSDYRKLGQRILHHEFSSILIDRHAFGRARWKRLNRSKYRSNNHGLEFVSRGLGRDENEALFRDGFLTSYGSSSLENDVNIYAEYLFVLPQHLDAIGRRHRQVRKKTRMIRRFYCGIDRRFAFCAGRKGRRR